MNLTVHFVDAFTDKVFHGNSAAVIVCKTWLDDSVMQSIAFENNLSETAFIVEDKQDLFSIRWFSPLTEIDFCGHATLASAFVLFTKDSMVSQLTFSAKAVGQIQVNKIDNGFIEMNFPNRKPEPISTIPEALINGLSIKPEEVWRNQQAYFVVYNEEKMVRDVISQSDIIKALAPYDVIVTAKSHQYDFISRYFWPANGGDEDPVTGSAHAGLTPLWAEKLNKSTLKAYQASSRGGNLNCQLKGDRVLISGQAVEYLVGTISI